LRERLEEGLGERLFVWEAGGDAGRKRLWFSSTSSIETRRESRILRGFEHLVGMKQAANHAFYEVSITELCKTELRKTEFVRWSFVRLEFVRLGEERRRGGGRRRSGLATVKIRTPQ
jgi:hypothetical protein